MVYNPYFAIVYAYDDDGEFEASMPCFTEEEVMKKASRYDNKVRVVRKGLQSLWIRVKEKEKIKHNPITTLGATSGMSAKKMVGVGVYYKDRRPFVGDRSDMFYDGWKGQKEKIFR